MPATRAADSTIVELERVIRLLKPLEIAASPFTTRPRTNERPHWTKPSLVAQVKFTEWTDDGLLRHPIYLGMRDDVKPETVTTGKKESGESEESRESEESEESRVGTSADLGRPTSVSPFSISSTRSSAGRARGRCGCRTGRRWRSRNLRKVFWPKLKITKGDLMRYYVRVAPYILPVVDGPSAHHEALPERHRRRAVLSAQGAGESSAGRARREGSGRQRGEPPDRRQPHDAALHDAARRDLAGPVVLARANRRTRPISAPSISIRCPG